MDIIQTIYTSNLHERHVQKTLVKIWQMKLSVKCVQVNTMAARERKTDVRAWLNRMSKLQFKNTERRK